MSNKFLLITAEDGGDILKSLAAPARLSILTLLHQQGPLNVNDIADMLELPQSSTSSHINSLEKSGLITTESQKGKKGSQKVCSPVYDEIVLSFADTKQPEEEVIEVSMPVGLYSEFDVIAPCGLCSDTGIIGYLDSPNTYLSPERMKAGLLWFTKGFVEYQFPNNARIAGKEIRELEIIMELSSEVPGTSANWPSDIHVSINDSVVAIWTSPGDFGDHRGKYTPDWWKLAGSQYGHLKSFRVTDTGTFIDGMIVSETKLSDLNLQDHRSIRVKISVPDTSNHPGGINIFGQGFGNYDQNIVLKLRT